MSLHPAWQRQRPACTRRHQRAEGEERDSLPGSVRSRVPEDGLQLERRTAVGGLHQASPAGCAALTHRGEGSWAPSPPAGSIWLCSPDSKSPPGETPGPLPGNTRVTAVPWSQTRPLLGPCLIKLPNVRCDRFLEQDSEWK